VSWSELKNREEWRGISARGPGTSKTSPRSTPNADLTCEYESQSSGLDGDSWPAVPLLPAAVADGKDGQERLDHHGRIGPPVEDLLDDPDVPR